MPAIVADGVQAEKGELVRRIRASQRPRSLVVSADKAWFDRNAQSKAMLRFDDHEDYLEIDLLSQETPDLPGRGDSRLSVHVTSAGFSGHSHPWVPGATLRSFTGI
jgi:hypothetical protein